MPPKRGGGGGGGAGGPSRSKPFSAKQKKAQLQAKRAAKRDAKHTGEDGSGSDGSCTDEPGAGAGDAAGSTAVPTNLLQVSLGKSGQDRAFSTVFAREKDDSVWKRKVASDLPLRMDFRGKPVYATLQSTHNQDPVLDHPKGVLLRRGMMMSEQERKGLYLTAESREMEAEAFKAWLEAIYRKYPREHLNTFEHSMEVWSQLWHTLASSDVICVVADVRNPLWHLPHSLVKQVTEELKKPLVILLNKADLVSQSNAQQWKAWLKTLYPSDKCKIVVFSSSGVNISGLTSLSQRRKTMRDARKSREPAVLNARKECVRKLLEAAAVDDAAIDAVLDKMDALTAASAPLTKSRTQRGETAAAGAGEAKDDEEDEETDDDTEDASGSEQEDEGEEEEEEEEEDEQLTRQRERERVQRQQQQQQEEGNQHEQGQNTSNNHQKDTSDDDSTSRSSDDDDDDEAVITSSAFAGRKGVAAGGAMRAKGVAAMRAALMADDEDEDDDKGGSDEDEEVKEDEEKGARKKSAAAIVPAARDPRFALSDKSARRRERKLKKEGKAAGIAPTSGAPTAATTTSTAESGKKKKGDEEKEASSSSARRAHEKVLTIGMVGHPNAGKSSVINCIAGEKRVSVSRTAGHTKRAQTVPLVPGLALLDCPGLVFPHALVSSFSSSSSSSSSSSAASSSASGSIPAPAPASWAGGARVVMPRSREERLAAAAAAAAAAATEAAAFPATASPPLLPTASSTSNGTAAAKAEAEAEEELEQRAIQELLGVIPIAQVREPYTAVRYLSERVPIERLYGLPAAPPPDSSSSSSWSALSLCEALAVKRGYHVAKIGRPDAHAAGREILYDCQDGILPLAWLPPQAKGTATAGSSADSGAAAVAMSHPHDEREGGSGAVPAMMA